MKGWETMKPGHRTTDKAKSEPEPDLYYEVAKRMDTMSHDDRVDIEIRKDSITARRIGGPGVSSGTRIDAHELDERKLCDAIKKESGNV